MMGPIRRALRKLGRVTGTLASREAPVILMYHRVADLAVDPWGLAVHPARFAEQIDALTRARHVVRLEELLDPQARRSGKPLAAVTFDDGYHDVYANARGALRRHDCPMTLFVTTGAIGSRREFWWDALGRILLECKQLPGKLDIAIGSTRFERAIPAAADAKGRDKVYREVYPLLKVLPDAEQQACLEQMARWASISLDLRPEHRAMTADEVAGIDDGLISIGAHTITHPSLPAHSFELQLKEIAGSTVTCEEMVGHAVSSLAFPFGDNDDHTVRAAREAGITHACTTHEGILGAGSDRLRLPRMYVGDWSGDELLSRIRHYPWA